MGSPAQPLLDWRDALVRGAQRLENWGNEPTGRALLDLVHLTPAAERLHLISPPDTSWHDEMVRKANASFLPAPQKPPQQAAPGALRQQARRSSDDKVSAKGY